jgi:hypothetical protein
VFSHCPASGRHRLVPMTPREGTRLRPPYHGNGFKPDPSDRHEATGEWPSRYAADTLVPESARVRTAAATPHSREIATQGGTPPPVRGDMRQSGRKGTSAHRHSLNNPRRVTGSGVVAAQDGSANADGAATADVDKQQRGEGRRLFRAVCPLSVALRPQSHPHRPANSGFPSCRYSAAVIRQAADLGLCLVVQRTGMSVRRHSRAGWDVLDFAVQSRP